MVMHCGIKRRRRSCLSEESIHNGELHQQTLLDMSVQKLQEEQVKHGIEPRLLRFVLINNAIKSLQSHLMITNDTDDEFVILTNSSNDLFLSNTINHGLFSSSISSPLTPAKVSKMDTDHFLTNSPLITVSSPSLGCTELDTSPVPSMSSTPSEPIKESSLNCKRNNEMRSLITSSDNLEHQKKRPRPLTLDQLQQPEESDVDLPSPMSESLSPIDFAKVDVSLYDFDARTNLVFPQVIEPQSRHTTTNTPSGLSCSLQAQTIATSTKLEHIDQQTDDIDNSNDDVVPATSTSSSRSTSSSLSPEGFDNFDDTHEIDRIVSLLMA